MARLQSNGSFGCVNSTLTTYWKLNLYYFMMGYMLILPESWHLSSQSFSFLLPLMIYNPIDKRIKVHAFITIRPYSTTSLPCHERMMHFWASANSCISCVSTISNKCPSIIWIDFQMYMTINIGAGTQLSLFQLLKPRRKKNPQLLALVNWCPNRTERSPHHTRSHGRCGAAAFKCSVWML